MFVFIVVSSCPLRQKTVCLNVEVIWSLNTGLKLVVTQALGENIINVPPLSDLENLDVKVSCEVAN